MTSWRPNTDSPPNGSPLELHRDGVLVGAVYLLCRRWWAVAYGPRVVRGKFARKREAMYRVMFEAGAVG